MSCKQKTLKNVKKGFVCVKNIENRALSRQEFVKKTQGNNKKQPAASMAM